ncbi:hypothetical protein VTL71DRAFT_2328 [Oculimacula yallundae]|uniref:Uncharacterized protein n=1 Tax=Oculimacula yallundae TaxID=86028 RepID=A0ABR4C9S7_9HELO
MIEQRDRIRILSRQGCYFSEARKTHLARLVVIIIFTCFNLVDELYYLLIALFNLLLTFENAKHAAIYAM